eukprot:Clim_evm22s246 gene=Clim_evmTU22s246
MIYSVYIINKAGSLIFQQDYIEGYRLPANERIMLASTFHSLFAIAANISPANNSSGIKTLDCDSFRLECMQTATGTKFMLLADPLEEGLPHFLQKVYELYADHVLKNPFYSLEMPIRIQSFESNLRELLTSKT